MTDEVELIKKIREEVDNVTDGRGKHVDEGIKNLVVALNLHGVETNGSCQGHTNWGRPYPWVSFENSQEEKVRALLESMNDNPVQMTKFTVTDMQLVPADILGRLGSIGLNYKSINEPSCVTKNLPRIPDMNHALEEVIAWMREDMDKFANHLFDKFHRENYAPTTQG
jgi:hypothetical protein